MLHLIAETNPPSTTKQFMSGQVTSTLNVSRSNSRCPMATGCVCLPGSFCICVVHSRHKTAISSNCQLNQRHLHSPWHCAFCLLLPSLSIHQVLRQRTMWSLVAEKYEQGPGATLSLRTSRWRLSGAQKHHGWIGQKRGGEGASARVGQPQQRVLWPARAAPLFQKKP